MIVFQSVFWPLTDTVLMSLKSPDTKVHTKVTMINCQHCGKFAFCLGKILRMRLMLKCFHRSII